MLAHGLSTRFRRAPITFQNELASQGNVAGQVAS